ncbi:MAG: hypothetical protein G01um101456_267 [Parcubacteria group bacterium Gr01-1014_56]|nr:MAG: hypothetical protein G01um101456_267 [Parcubacteria group bacterium Gr01-1014_56]
MEIPPSNYQNKKQDEGVGPLIGIIIIVAIIAAGGIYFLVTQEMERRATPPDGQEQASL